MFDFLMFACAGRWGQIGIYKEIYVTRYSKGTLGRPALKSDSQTL